MQQPLASPLSAIQPAYDVVVIGSGYGGGVAASRLARAGQRVCVIEKGKEFPTGSFPSRLPELRRELQLNGGKLRSGSRTGLFDFRLGADIHVLVGCGLGGGSLINAGVALKPDARVFADPYSAERARKSNNAQVMTLGARVVGPELAESLVRIWLNSEFQGGASARKVAKIAAAEARLRPD